MESSEERKMRLRKEKNRRHYLKKKAKKELLEEPNKAKIDSKADDEDSREEPNNTFQERLKALKEKVKALEEKTEPPDELDPELIKIRDELLFNKICEAVNKITEEDLNALHDTLINELKEMMRQ